ncbi:hypothetical protein [Tateyamaria sp. SN3-11]|uniref:hypothetical protein n=1 Tax=Tateyamaria sp. SN3-11 TaxID=3092147 RepID=UPI0039E8241D
MIFYHTHGWQESASTTVVEVRLCKLRKKSCDTGVQSECIQTRQGERYSITVFSQTSRLTSKTFSKAVVNVRNGDFRCYS